MQKFTLAIASATFAVIPTILLPLEVKKILVVIWGSAWGTLPDPEVINEVYIIFARSIMLPALDTRFLRLRNRFRVILFEAVLAEAQQLTEEKKKLVM